MALQASAAAGRALWRAGQHQLSAVGSGILLAAWLADADAKQKVSAMSAEAIGVQYSRILAYSPRTVFSRIRRRVFAYGYGYISPHGLMVTAVLCVFMTLA